VIGGTEIVSRETSGDDSLPPDVPNAKVVLFFDTGSDTLPSSLLSAAFATGGGIANEKPPLSLAPKENPLLAVLMETDSTFFSSVKVPNLNPIEDLIVDSPEALGFAGVLAEVEVGPPKENPPLADDAFPLPNDDIAGVVDAAVPNEKPPAPMLAGVSFLFSSLRSSFALAGVAPTPKLTDTLESADGLVNVDDGEPPKENPPVPIVPTLGFVEDLVPVLILSTRLFAPGLAASHDKHF
jgi:hypothetical protein